MRFIRIFSIIGLIISLYLIYAYEISKSIICLGSGCEIVANSVYSRFLNVSLPIWGALFYIIILALSFVKKFNDLLLFIALVGAVFSFYLTMVEVFILRAICNWCIISAICSWLIAINLVLGNVKK